MVFWLATASLSIALSGPVPSSPDALDRVEQFERARSLERQADTTGAISVLEAHQHGSDPVATAFRFHLERLRLFQGQLPEEDIRELLAPSGGPHVRWGITRQQEAWALLRLAELQRRAEHPRAQETHERAVVEYPRWTPEPNSASRELLYARAKNSVRDMDYEGGLAIYEGLHASAHEPEKTELARTIGHLLGDKMRNDYPRVAQIYGELAARPDATPDDVQYWAYAVGKFDPTGSAEIYEQFAERFPTHSDREKALFFVVWTNYDIERFAEAVQGFDQFLTDYPSTGWRYSARWYRGLSLYRLGQFERAFEDFDFTARHTRNRSKGRYWAARALLELDKKTEAYELLQRVAKGDSFSYYPMLARELLPTDLRPPLYDNDSAPPATIDSEQDVERAFARLSNDLRGLVTEAVAAADSGRIELGQALLLHLEQRGVDAAANAPLHRWLRSKVDAAHREVRSQDAKRCRRLLDDDPTDERIKRCWNRLYPTPYAARIESVRGSVPASLFWAIMRQESFFIPNARSHADALGLMQLIPQVGGPAAQALGKSFAAYELYRPHTNLQLFAHAANERFNRFRGHVPLILMSYNATPEKARTWLEHHRDLPFDLFVEEIPYGETRDYVKRIASHLARYRTLQGAQSPMLERAGLPHPLKPVREAFGDVLRTDRAQNNPAQSPKAI